MLRRFRKFVLRGKLTGIAVGIVISTILAALVLVFVHALGLLTDQTYERKTFWILTCVLYAAWFWWGAGIIDLIEDVRDLFRKKPSTLP